MTGDAINYDSLLQKITEWARDLGFQQLGVSDIELGKYEKELNDWLQAGFHGEMDYMARHGSKRSRPDELVEQTAQGEVYVFTLRVKG